MIKYFGLYQIILDLNNFRRSGPQSPACSCVFVQVNLGFPESFMIDRDHRDLRKPRDADCTKSVPVMTEALASTPESRRYVFCLAQSYGNAGRMGRGGVVCATPGGALLPAARGRRGVPAERVGRLRSAPAPGRAAPSRGPIPSRTRAERGRRDGCRGRSGAGLSR